MKLLYMSHFLNSNQRAWSYFHISHQGEVPPLTQMAPDLKMKWHSGACSNSSYAIENSKACLWQVYVLGIGVKYDDFIDQFICAVNIGVLKWKSHRQNRFWKIV